MPPPITRNSRNAGARFQTPPRGIFVREYENLPELPEEEQRDLERFALDERGGGRHVLTLQKGRLRTQNYVGVIETRQGTPIEILPKVDLADDGHERTRQVFMTMLRTWRGIRQAQADAAGIRAVRRFNMFEAFVHMFLTNVVLLSQRGLARAYQTREANLSCLRGRILFPRHIRENLADRSRFYVGYDEFTVDRPANRLISLALQRLAGDVRHPANRQRIRQLRLAFSSVPPSTNVDDDWAKHRVDRSMRHYDAVTPWLRLFLFGHGLATFAGRHVNRAMLFPMEEVFEDFVTASMRRHQQRFAVHSQEGRRYLATDGDGKKTFLLKPDIVLRENGQTRFILDAKWKRLDLRIPARRVSQADAYQLFAYGKRYDCRRVILVYPETTAFRETIRYRFDEQNLEMACFPFNVEHPERSVETMMRNLLRPDS